MKKNFVYGHHIEDKHWPKLVRIASCPSNIFHFRCTKFKVIFCILELWISSKHFHFILTKWSSRNDVYTTSIGATGFSWHGEGWRYTLQMIHWKRKISLLYLLYTKINIAISLHRINERLQGCRTREPGKFNQWAVTVDTMSIISWHEVHICSFMSTI